MSSITFHEGDNREVLRRLIAEGVRVHSVTTDPPYHLESVVKRFGKEGAAAAGFGTNGAFSRASKGFMNRGWDGADDDGTRIAQDPEFWSLIYDILLPGGYVLAFSSPRTGHWQACAMEMAGFIMHPFFGWVYGSGFPKAHNASKAIDRELGAERERVPVVQTPGWQRNIGNSRPYMSDPNHTTVGDRAATAAAEWDGWAYGTQSLKPALEPIYFGQKPFSEKNGALNLLKHGVGAVNIDGCRVAYANDADMNQARVPQPIMHNDARGVYQAGTGAGRNGDVFDPSKGRHPANLLHDGSPEVVAMFPAKAGAAAAASGKSLRHGNTSVARGRYAGLPEGREPAFHGDSGSAARFFNSFPRYACGICNDTGICEGGVPGIDAYQEPCICGGPLPDADPLFYNPKASKADRAGSLHPTVKPPGIMEWLVTLVTPPGGTTLDPFAGSGSTGAAALAKGFNAILIEREPDYADFLRKRFNIPAPVAVIDEDMLSVLGGTADEIDLIG